MFYPTRFGQGASNSEIVNARRSQRGISIKSNAKPEPTPAGKRAVRSTVRGSLNGYVSGRFWTTFGIQFDPVAEERARLWLEGGEA